MIRGKEIVEARRADEILVEADKLSRVGIRKGKVEIDDLISTDADFGRNKADDSLIVLAEDLALIDKVFV